MNEEPEKQKYPENNLSYGTGRKVIMPLTPAISVEPSEVSPPVPAPTADLTSAQPLTPTAPYSAPQSFNAPVIDTSVIYGNYVPSDSQPPHVYSGNDGKLDQVEKPVSRFRWIKILVATILGGISGILSYSYWVIDIQNYALLLLKNFSPLTLFYGWVSILIGVVIYYLILKYLVKSQSPFAQASVAVVSTSILSIITAGIFQRPSILISITDFLTVIFLGGLVFGLTTFVAEKRWTWPVARPVCAAIFVVALLATAQVISLTNSNSVAEQKTDEAKSSATAKKLAETGDYKFSEKFVQYYPNEAIQKRFEVLGIRDQSMYYPESKSANIRSTFLTLADNTQDRRIVSIEVFKRDSFFKPPKSCGNPLIRTSFTSEKESCELLKRISETVSIYGHYQYGNNEGKKSHDGYYLSSGETLILISNTGNSLDEKSAISLLENMNIISLEELSTKSKAMATKKLTQTTNAKSNTAYPVYSAGYIPGGYTLTGNYLQNADDPEFSYVFSKYESSSPSNFGSSITISQFKKPVSFNPPNCGKSSPGVGLATTNCKATITKLKNGKPLYYGSFDYYGDYGETIITVNGAISGRQLSEAEIVSIYDSLSLTDAKSLNLQ